MFSSLASFIFGSNTPETTNSDVNQNPTEQQQKQQTDSEQLHVDERVRIDANNTIEVTASTPSVTGANPSNVFRQVKRGKHKRNKQQQKHNNTKQAQVQGNGNGNGKGNGNGNVKPKPTPTITTLLTPNDSFDEDDWCIVEKENEDDSLPRTDSEEELSIVEVKPAAPALAPQPTRRRPPSTSHSLLYSGPRPQQQRNLLQRARNSGARGATLNASTLSPPRSNAGAVADADGLNVAVAAIAAAPTADGGMTQSLYVVSPNGETHNNSGNSVTNNNVFGADLAMEESWFVTPPPCFTSMVPVNMETSPFENLLIEHPSMSVYHSIRSAQVAAESYVNIDLDVQEPQQSNDVAAVSGETAVIGAQNGRRTQTPTQTARAPGARIDRYTASQLKQELLMRKGQQVHDKKERQNLCRGAIKRANKVRDFQSQGNRPRRADMQHFKLISGANNNRKCCFA